MQSILDLRLKGGAISVLSGVIFTLVFLMSVQPVHAAADSCTWTGLGGDNNVTTAGNWSGCDNGTVPEHGDNLIFPTGPINKTVVFNTAAWFDDITFSGSDYAISTSSVFINVHAQNNMIISGDNNIFTGAIRLFPTTTSTLTVTGTGTTVSGELIIQPEAANTDVILDIQSDMSVSVLAQAGSDDIRSVVKTGPGTFEQGNDAVTGLTVIDGIDITEGVWKCDSQFCLGDDSNVYNIGVDATLEFAQAAWINIGSITGEGIISFTNADARVLLGTNNISGIFSGTVEGFTDSVIEIIGGTWTFTGTNTDIGNGYTSYYVNGGTLLANASDNSLGLSPFSISDGILGGSGTIGGLSIYSGIIAPGNSPGCLTADGDVSFTDPGSIYSVQIQGDTACSEYDRLTANGTIYLNNATLDFEVDSGLSLTNGQVLTVMSASAIDGTFDGLANGDTVIIGNFSFVINYNSTNVTLTYDDGSSDGSSSVPISELADTGTNTVVPVVIGITLSVSALLLTIGSRRYSAKDL